MNHYFVWIATKCPEDRRAEVEVNIKSGVARCIALNNQTVPDQLRIEVSDGPFSLEGDVTTADQKTIVRFTYSLLQNGHTSFQFFG